MMGKHNAGEWTIMVNPASLSNSALPMERLATSIYLAGGEKVMVDHDLSARVERAIPLVTH